ncbi:MAG: hypothetical protein AAGI06_17565 [Pseudomonadota bacterium]
MSKRTHDVKLTEAELAEQHARDLHNREMENHRLNAQLQKLQSQASKKRHATA